jgi:hypothetical protein
MPISSVNIICGAGCFRCIHPGSLDAFQCAHFPDLAELLSILLSILKLY